MENIFLRMYKYIKNKFSNKKMLIEPKPNYYDQGVNVVVMKKENFENLKIDTKILDKKIKLENGFISVYDLSDEEVEDMIQLYTDELNELNKKIRQKELEIKKLNNEG